jgi:hypothetical protein
MPYREDAERNRREAERCRALADQMADPVLRAQVRDVAKTYDMLAEQIERLKLVGPRD